MADIVTAYHNDPDLKARVVAEMQDHAAQDRLVQGYGYWKDGRGCAVGCLIKSGDHAEYESRFGDPWGDDGQQLLGVIADAIERGAYLNTPHAPAERVERRKFYRKDWPLAKLLEARSDGMLTDDGEAWRYEYSHKDGQGDYDMLYRPTPAEPLDEVAKLREALERIAAGLQRENALHSDPGCLCHQCGASYGDIRAFAQAALQQTEGSDDR